MHNKKIPQWVKDKEKENQQKESVVFVGELGAAGVVDGKLPNGEPYGWFKRRPDPKRIKS